MDITTITLGELLSSTNETIRRNAISIFKQLRGVERNEKRRKIKLYYHKTDGGAEYLFDTFISCADGRKEGAIKDETKYVIRLDGQPELIIAR